MSRYVLDSSALLAVLFREIGHEMVIDRGHAAVISAVNYAEVLRTCGDRGVPQAVAGAYVAELSIGVVPFDGTQAHVAASFQPAAGEISFGTRACLALAFVRGLTAVTVDRSWAADDLGVTVELIR